MNWSFELSKAPTASFCSSFPAASGVLLQSPFHHLISQWLMCDLSSRTSARRDESSTKYASYSTTGTLLCTVCHLQLKSETLWEGHLRSAGHLHALSEAYKNKRKSPLPCEHRTTSKFSRRSARRATMRRRAQFENEAKH